MKGCTYMPIFFILFLLFGLWFHYEKSKATKSLEKANQDYWTEEQESQYSRKQDLSCLPYLIPDLACLPMEATSDSYITDYQSKIKAFTQKRLLNTSHMTNTQIKREYGRANFESICEYDENYYQFLSLLNEYGNDLFEHKEYSMSRQVFEYAVACKSDLLDTYTTLTKIYLTTQDDESLQSLLQTVKEHNNKWSEKLSSMIQKELYQYLLEE